MLQRGVSTALLAIVSIDQDRVEQGLLAKCSAEPAG